MGFEIILLLLEKFVLPGPVDRDCAILLDVFQLLFDFLLSRIAQIFDWSYFSFIVLSSAEVSNSDETWSLMSTIWNKLNNSYLNLGAKIVLAIWIALGEKRVLNKKLWPWYVFYLALWTILSANGLNSFAFACVVTIFWLSTRLVTRFLYMYESLII